MAQQIALFNHKGGVSKTTTAFNLGWMLLPQAESFPTEAMPALTAQTPAMLPATVAPSATVTSMLPLPSWGVAYQARTPSPREFIEPPFTATTMLPGLKRLRKSYTAIL